MSTVSEQGALQFSLSTEEGLMHIPSQEGNIKHSSSPQTDFGYRIYTKKRLRDDPEDEWDFRTSSSEEDSFIQLPSSERACAPSTDPEETPVATDNPQVSPAPSISVRKTTECSTSNEKTVWPCRFTQGPLECSISSQDTQTFSGCPTGSTMFSI